jgi:hypothetical protein
MPDDLANILELAGQADVRILILDADAPVLPGLPLAEPSSHATRQPSSFSPMPARLLPGAGLVHFHRSTLMFPDLISPALDFEHQLGACVNAMSQDDAIGQILVFERMSGTLHMRHIASADLVDTDVDDYEMVVFDGGNTSGDTWKHVFFPRQREHYFVYEA